MKSFYQFSKIGLDCDPITFTPTFPTDSPSRGIFVGVRFDDKSIRNILNYAKQIGIKNPVKKEDLHCTLIASRIAVDYEPSSKIKAFALVKCLRELNRCIVLELESEELKARHEALRLQFGMMSDFGCFIPHITLSYEPQEIDIQLFNAMFAEFEVCAVSEYVEEMITN